MTQFRGAGDRRHRITIMRRTAPITNLETTPTYTTGETKWAAIEPLSAREVLISQQSQQYSEATTKITMQYTANLSASDQITFGTRTYEVLGQPINRDELKVEMVVLAVERM